MESVTLVRRLHQHRQWVNRKLIAVVETLTPLQLHRTFEIGQGTIWRSLTHLYAAEYLWLDALLGNEDPLTPGDVPGRLPGNQEGENGLTTLSELRTEWDRLDGRWQQYLSQLTSESLDQPVVKKSTSSGSGRPQTTTRADVLLHVCTHAQYTVAQVMNMLRHSGFTGLPDPMLITLARAEFRD
ncbi:MAG: DinB family protein [Fuerstiella sp.]